MKIIIQQVTAKFQDLRQRIIWDNDPLFIAKDFNEFNHIFGLTDGKTSPYCPQSNSKLERFHKYSRVECISPNTQLRLDDARKIMADYIGHHNMFRLHSAIGNIIPADKLTGREKGIFKSEDQKPEATRRLTAAKNQHGYQSSGEHCSPLTHAA
ncbi:MAG: integrase core domain-containing protein [Dissulfurispiraceae bacterium]